MSKIRSALVKSCQELRSSEKMRLEMHGLQVFLIEKFGSRPGVTVGDVKEKIKTLEDDEVYWSFLKSLDMVSLCDELSQRGNILLMKNIQHHEDSWIILDKAKLLSEVNGKIFAPEDFKQYQKLATSTGVVRLSKLVSLFPELDPNMMT